MAVSTTRHAHHSVLVVEDRRDMRESLATFFECMGFEVTGVSNGLEALHVMSTLGLRPCAVVADLIMPVMDGLTMAKRMAEDAALASIPVIALTAHEGLRRFALSEGFSAGFLKPTDFDRMVAAIAACCPASAAATGKRPA